MNSLLLLLFLLPSVLSECIKWAECDKTTTCFSKYASRAGLGLFDGKIAPGAAAPTVGLSLRKEKIPDTVSGKIEVTTVVIQVEIAGMKEEDFAAIGVDESIFVGCLKSKAHDKAAFKALSTTPSLVGNVFCCTLQVAHMHAELVAVSSALPLAVIYSSAGGRTSLPTDFSVQQTLPSLKYREKVTCDISAFRMETPLGEGIVPYYPLQDPNLARCGVPNQAIRKHLKGAEFGKQWKSPPYCVEGKWHHEHREITLKTALFCVPRPNQTRVSCAGHAPPTEILCGKLCGTMNPDVFKCANTTDLQVLDNSTTWRKVDKILCTSRGFVSSVADQHTLLSSEAKVQCKVKNPHNPLISALDCPRYLAVLLAVVIYTTLFTTMTIACRIIFSRWAAQVEQLGPIRPFGSVMSSRAMKNVTSNNANNNNNESNRNTPSNRTHESHQSARSTRR